MATPHVVGTDLKLSIDSKTGKGKIEFDIHELSLSKSGNMKMLLSLSGFTPMGVNLDGKPIKANLQIGVDAK